MAWLLVQHSDHDLDFQKECLKLMKSSRKGQVGLENIAYLEDRIRVHEGRPQLYGTQFDEPVNFAPKQIADPENLDKRRKKAGMSTFSEYKKLMESSYSQPHLKKLMEEHRKESKDSD